MTGSGEASLADVRAIAEAVVDLLAERLVVYAGPVASARGLGARDLMDAARPWMYTHATECGAIRMGSRPKARFGFDRAGIENRSATTSSRHETREPARSRRPTTVPDSANLILRP